MLTWGAGEGGKRQESQCTGETVGSACGLDPLEYARHHDRQKLAARPKMLRDSVDLRGGEEVRASGAEETRPKTQSTFSPTATPRLQLLASRTQSLPVPLRSSPSSSSSSSRSTQPMSHVLSASRSGHPSSSASSSHSFMPPTPSVRDTHSFDLAFGPFQERCSAFLSSLDAYVLRGKEEIQARRASHTTTLRKAAEEKARLEKEIDGEGDKESRLLKVLEKEKNEVRDFEQALAELKLSLGGVETQIKIGEGDAQERETQIATLKKGQSALPHFKLTLVERGPAYLRIARLSFDACRESHAGGVPRRHAEDRRCRPG